MCRETAPPTDAVQKLISLNSIDPSLFVEGDKQIVKANWNKVFKHEYEGAITDTIFDAIASKSGVASPECKSVSLRIYLMDVCLLLVF